MVKVGELCKPEYGFTEKAAESGDARFIRITDITEDGIRLCYNYIMAFSFPTMALKIG